ncbi:hypothetical protein BLOT_001166 [Blomia tropicalis]|nr:hypothetical protein BLOT_001166 [Blomia tropicalis]
MPCHAIHPSVSQPTGCKCDKIEVSSSSSSTGGRTPFRPAGRESQESISCVSERLTLIYSQMRPLGCLAG